MELCCFGGLSPAPALLWIIKSLVWFIHFPHKRFTPQYCSSGIRGEATLPRFISCDTCLFFPKEVSWELKSCKSACSCPVRNLKPGQAGGTHIVRIHPQLAVSPFVSDRGKTWLTAATFQEFEPLANSQKYLLPRRWDEAKQARKGDLKKICCFFPTKVALTQNSNGAVKHYDWTNVSNNKKGEGLPEAGAEANGCLKNPAVIPSEIHQDTRTVLKLNRIRFQTPHPAKLKVFFDSSTEVYESR